LHRVDDEQRLDGVHGRVQIGDLAHHRLVDRQASGRVHDQHVVVMPPRPVDGALRDRYRLLRGRRREEIDAHLHGERLQLLDCRRTIDVGGYQQHLLLLASDQTSELRGRGRLAGALQAGEEDDRRRRRGEVERLRSTAHQRRQFARDDADQRLSGCQRSDDLGTDRLVAQVGDERLDDRQRDVGFEQRQANLAQRVLDVLVGQPRFAAKRLDDTRQAFGQGFEHGNCTPGAQHEACGALR
jgi:hypothetical protein